MYFKKIKMHGFKSFAEPVNIEFDRGITCIVGPNGGVQEQHQRRYKMGFWGNRALKCFRGGKMQKR